ncbi:uncharacterized protein [Triticum aestivum]|uniref:uncharacterized protein n=1 Tax=Triticum aestivum TaxID=4565 RepID=UPI001D02D5A1|nr:uncharacterized protein LOC123148964 [Triticum aestivum]
MVCVGLPVRVSSHRLATWCSSGQRRLVIWVVLGTPRLLAVRRDVPAVGAASRDCCLGRCFPVHTICATAVQEEIDRCTHRIEPKEVCQSSNTWSRPATSDATTIVLPALSALNFVSDGMHSAYMVEESCPQALTTEQPHPQQGHGDLHHRAASEGKK